MSNSNITFRAFTTKNTSLVNSLRNRVKIVYNGQTAEVDALWDTGATRSCISHDVVSFLSMISTGKSLINTPSGSQQVNTYLIDVILPNNVNVKDLQVTDSEIGNQGIGILIGMDIICAGDFAVSNFNGKTVFTFRTPSKSVTDYVEQINFENLIGPRHGKGKRKHKA